MSFRIIRNDITKVSADAIVNTANPKPIIGGGVDRAIYTAAGEAELMAERQKIGNLPPGEVAITPAFALDAKYIVHVSGPWWEGGSHNEESILRTCYEKALSIAHENACESIAFPLLATGSYGFPKDLGIRIAVDSFTAFLEEHDMEIILVVFTDESVRISGELADGIESFIDSDYVVEAMEDEYGEPERPLAMASAAFNAPAESMVRPSVAGFGAKASGFFGARKATVQSDAASLDDVLKDIHTDSFAKHLQQLINKKGLKNSEVYAAANISKQYFSKLLKGQVKPSKEKVLALAVGLRLNLDETIDFLQIAGYALSPISQTDAVVKYFIQNKDYNVLKIDIILFDYGLDPLSNG